MSGLVTILTLSTIILLFATILVACFLCDFTHCWYWFSSCLKHVQCRFLSCFILGSPSSKTECVRLLRCKILRNNICHGGALMHKIMFDKTESRHSENPFRKPQKGTTISKNSPFKILSSGTAAALLIWESTRPAVGQAGAAAPWPLNVLPNKAQKSS